MISNPFKFLLQAWGSDEGKNTAWSWPQLTEECLLLDLSSGTTIRKTWLKKVALK